MIPRYASQQMTEIWSDENRFRLWQEVETVVCEVRADRGEIPAEAAREIRARGAFETERVLEIERTVQHDVIAFLTNLAEHVGPSSRFVHQGMTSSDLLDTSFALQIKQAGEVLRTALVELLEATEARAIEHRDTVMIGRTHGIWAEPTTFGMKLATWAFEIDRDRKRLAAAARSIAVGKISGAVGTYAHTPPIIEEYVCERMGLAIEPASSQITHRDRHAEFLSVLALIGASLERFATEIRHLQRSEVGEARESFGKGQKGSSAMPHKRNPIASENVTGLARLLRSYASAGFENVALWHERDISHSSAERVALPDSCLILDFALVRMTKLIDNLVVNTDRMLENLESTRGLVFSQAVLLALIEEQGLSRDAAYRIVQRNAMRAWDEKLRLRDLLAEDIDVALHPDVLDRCFSAGHFLRHSAVVFERLELVS